MDWYTLKLIWYFLKAYKKILFEEKNINVRYNKLDKYLINICKLNY